MLLNDAEIRMLTEEPNLARAAREVMEMGPAVVVAKRGEYGAALFSERRLRDPGLLLEDVRDPTGPATASREASSATSTGAAPAARTTTRRPPPGDGLRLGARLVQRRGLRPERVRSLTTEEIEEQLRDFRRITHFEVEPITT